MKKFKTDDLIYIFYVLNIFNFILNKKYNCFFICVLITVLSYYLLKRNISFSMLIALLVSIFVFSCNKIMEGNDEETENTEVSEVADETIEEEEAALDDEEVDTVGDDLQEKSDTIDPKKIAQALMILGKKRKTSAEKERKRIENRFQRCIATLRPINECRDMVQSQMVGDEEVSQTVTQEADVSGY